MMELQKTGFHVIEIQKFRKISNLPMPYNTSIFNLLRDLEKDQIKKLTIVDGLDEFLRSSTEDAIIQARKTLNEAITGILTIGASLVFVVKCDIDDIPDNPKVHNKPLAMIFPRPHDIGSMEPGYLYYPVM